jgi:hypothetical protein
MSNTIPLTGDQLANALRALGVNFLGGGAEAEESMPTQPARLIVALAESDEARLRLSLIPVFLEHPEIAALVREAAKGLAASARLTLRCYYSAAVFLQKKYRTPLRKLLGEQPQLVDHFSMELGLQTTDDPDRNLQMLALRHQELSGIQVNWLGTYEHAVRIWIKGLEIERS